ncbi:uncharacterized protein METZ01_LOCUS275591, partial [marine metagenome]
MNTIIIQSFHGVHKDIKPYLHQFLFLQLGQLIVLFVVIVFFTSASLSKYSGFKSML